MSYKRNSPQPVVEGGTGAQTFTSHGLLIGQATSAISALTAASTGTVLTGVTGSDPAFSATPSVTSITISNAPIAGTDGANKAYVDLVAAGFTFEVTTVAGTTANLSATYNNGAAGVGATLTNNSTQAAFSVDGVSPALNDRILVKDQSSQLENGIYTLTVVGSGATDWVLTRATDYDQAPSEIKPGSVVPVSSGTANANTTWLETAIVNVVGTDPIVFSLFTGGSLSTFHTDSGNATVVSNAITIAGGTGINTSGSGATVTVNLSTPVSIANGGTNASSMATTDGTVYYDGASLVTTATGTSGWVLTSGGAGVAPTYQAVSASGAVTSVSAGTNISVTGTATAPIVNVAGTTNHTVQLGTGATGLTSLANGTTGQVLKAVSTLDPAWGQVVLTTDVTGILPIANGGTSASSFAITDGTVYYDGSKLVTTATGTSGWVLTSGGAGVAPAYAAPAASSISITGDTGGAIVGNAFIFAGGSTGLSFGGSGTTETLTFAGITANGGTVSLATDATTSTINVGTGAGVKTSTFGSTNSTSATTLQSGSGALALTSTNGTWTGNSGTGALGLSTDATNTTISLGTGAGVKAVTLGSTNTSSSTIINSGSGGIKAIGVASVAVANKNYVTINTSTGALGSDAGASSSISITGDSGGALTGSAFTITGSTTGLTFAGAGSTETLGGTLVVSNGGTGAATLTGVVLGNGTSAMTALTYVPNTSWTPVLNFGGATTGIAYSTQVGFYARMGPIVSFNMNIDLSSKGSATGAATITGLPVSAATGNVVSLRFSALTFTGAVFVRLAGTTLFFEVSATGGNVAGMTNTNFANTSSVIITGTYIA